MGVLFLLVAGPAELADSMPTTISPAPAGAATMSAERPVFGGSGSKRLCCIPIFSEKWSLNFGVRKARGKQGLSKPLAKSFLMANAS